MLDVRLPIGWMFTIFGVLVVAQGILHPMPVKVAEGSVEINLCWGAVMLCFGLFMLFLSWKTGKHT